MVQIISYLFKRTLSGQMIKGMIFDFGNVICRFDNRVFIRSISKHGPLSEAEMLKRLYIESGIPEEYETGKISSREFYEKVKALLGLDMDIDEFRGAFTSIFYPVTETLELVRNLKGKYKLALLSNTNEWDHEHAIKNVGIYPLFDAVSLSYELGVKKPDERIYLDCMDKLGLEPEECVYIDDIREYAEKASDLGMIGYHYVDHDRLLEFLNHLLPG